MPRKRPNNANRSDLPGYGGNQPTTVPKGQQYGQRQAQEQSQQAMPLPQRQQAPDLSKVLAAAQGAQMPTGVVEGDTENPDEPVTAGLPFGEGPGPDALMTAGNPDLEALRPFLPMLELAANQPNASASMRNVVRRLRGAMPA